MLPAVTGFGACFVGHLAGSGACFLHLLERVRRNLLRRIAERVLFLLADGYSVYLEAADGPTIDVVVDIDSGTPRLRSERTRAIARGDFVVLRSEGGSGDYIMRVIDPIEDVNYTDDYFYVSGL